MSQSGTPYAPPPSTSEGGICGSKGKRLCWPLPEFMFFGEETSEQLEVVRIQPRVIKYICLNFIALSFTLRPNIPRRP